MWSVHGILVDHRLVHVTWLSVPHFVIHAPSVWMCADERMVHIDIQMASLVLHHGFVVTARHVGEPRHVVVEYIQLCGRNTK